MRKFIMVMTIVLLVLSSTFGVFAAGDPNVVLVNPQANSTVYSNNLLISVKLTQPKTIQVSIYEEKQLVNGTYGAVNVNTLTTTNGPIGNMNFYSTLITTVKHTSSNNLSFYTKQVNGLKPGLYRIEIKTLDSADKETNKSNSYVVVKEKAEAERVFETPQSGTMQFLQNLLKNIFGN